MTKRLLDFAYRALQWWIDGLWLGIPARWRTALFVPRDKITVRLGNGAEVTIDRVTHGRSDTTLTLSPSDSGAASKIAEAGAVATGADIAVVLPRTVVLTRTLSLPASAIGALREVLHHELDRLTPFAPDEIVFAHRVREHAGDKITVDVALARRSALEDAAASVTRLGLQPTAFIPAGEEDQRRPLDLISTRRFRLPFARIPITPWVAAVAALSFAIALYLPLLRYGYVLEQQERQTAAAREQAVAARTALDQQEIALARTDFLARRQSSYVPPITLLLDLTRELPEHTWLSRLSFTANEVLLQGESGAAPELLQVVESMARLQRAQFQTPVSRSESGKEQFTIVAAPVGSVQ